MPSVAMRSASSERFGTRARLALPAGCTQATGAQTLAWLRSRNTQELTAEGWRAHAGRQ